MNIADQKIAIQPEQKTLSWSRMALVGLLIALGCFYLGSWLIFKLHSTDYIAAHRQVLLEQRRLAPAPYMLGAVVNFAGNQTSFAKQWSLQARDLPSNQAFTIPTAALNKIGILRLVSSIGKPISPKSLGNSNDTRQLGIGIHQLSITAER